MRKLYAWKKIILHDNKLVIGFTAMILWTIKVIRINLSVKTWDFKCFSLRQWCFLPFQLGWWSIKLNEDDEVKCCCNKALRNKLTVSTYRSFKNVIARCHNTADYFHELVELNTTIMIVHSTDRSLASKTLENVENVERKPDSMLIMNSWRRKSSHENFRSFLKAHQKNPKEFSKKSSFDIYSLWWTEEMFETVSLCSAIGVASNWIKMTM